MRSPLRIGLLVAGIWLSFGGLYLSLGVFLPQFRGFRGRRSRSGPQMSAAEQLFVSLFFVGSGLDCVVFAFH